MLNFSVKIKFKFFSNYNIKTMRVFTLKKQLTDRSMSKNLIKFLSELSKVALSVGSSTEGELVVIDKLILVDIRGIEHELFDTQPIGETNLRDSKERKNLKNEMVSKYYKFFKSNSDLKIKNIIIYYHFA